jgi:integrase
MENHDGDASLAKVGDASSLTKEDVDAMVQLGRVGQNQSQPEEIAHVVRASHNSAGVSATSSVFGKPMDKRLRVALDELERERTAKGLGGKPWQVLTYAGVLRIARYTYRQKAAASLELGGDMYYLYQVRYSLNGNPSTQSLGRSDQISFDDAFKKAQDFHARVSNERLMLQLKKPLLPNKKLKREKTVHTFKSVVDALHFLRMQYKKGTTYYSVYWQLAILLPILGSHIDRLRWEDFDLDRNLLRIRYHFSDSDASELAIPISQDISNLMRSWKDFDYRQFAEYVFLDVREKSRSPRRLVVLDEELNASWGLYPLDPHDLGIFWKRELLNSAHLSKDFLDKAFGTPIFGKYSNQEDQYFLEYLLKKWWEIVDGSSIYPYSTPFPKFKKVVNREVTSSSMVLNMATMHGADMRKNVNFSLKDYSCDPKNISYDTKAVDLIYEDSIISNIVGETKSFSNRVWRSIEKIPVYYPDGHSYSIKADYIGLILASDLVEPRFHVEGHPGIFLVSPTMIGNPENLTHSGYEIEFGDNEEYKRPIAEKPDSFLKKIPLRIIPFVSGQLLRANIQNTKFLFRISKIGEAAPILIRVSELVEPSSFGSPSNI